MMELAIVILLLAIGAVVGSLVTYAWMSDTAQGETP
jgi:predicted ribosomally synthesized peptide with SipW-like signal peptide